MLLNGALGCGFWSWAAYSAHTIGSLPAVSLLGIIAAVFALRGKLIGLIGGALFYGVQMASYYSAAVQFGYRSSINIGVVTHLERGTLIINVFAVAGLAVAMALLVRRYRMLIQRRRTRLAQ